MENHIAGSGLIWPRIEVACFFRSPAGQGPWLVFFAAPAGQGPWLVFFRGQITSQGRGLFFVQKNKPRPLAAAAGQNRGCVFFSHPGRPGAVACFFRSPGLARGRGLFFSQPGAGQGPWLVFFAAGWPAPFLKEMDGLAGI